MRILTAWRNGLLVGVLAAGGSAGGAAAGPAQMVPMGNAGFEVISDGRPAGWREEGLWRAG